MCGDHTPEAGVQKLAATEAGRGKLGEAIGRAKYGGQRTLLMYRGQPAAAVVTLEDLARLEERPATRKDHAR